jgi:NAD(P)-dependent dehydrogenase (short-subunit alcohol dehydrogenase family)
MQAHQEPDTGTDRPLALVTGASSGIGLELARQFVAHDFDVILNAEDDELAAAEASLAGSGGNVRSVTADLSSYDGAERLVSAVTAGGRPLDAVALNAGIGVNGDFTRDIPLEDDLRLIAVNVTAVVHLAKRLLPAMVERGAGRVLITSSVAATMPGPYYATYAASNYLATTRAWGAACFIRVLSHLSWVEVSPSQALTTSNRPVSRAPWAAWPTIVQVMSHSVAIRYRSWRSRSSPSPPERVPLNSSEWSRSGSLGASSP